MEEDRQGGEAGNRGGARGVKRLGVIMFTDMVGSVAMQQRLGTEAYGEVIAKHDEMFRRALADSDDGEILSHTGDGMMMRFSDPSDAVETALRLQFLAGKTLVNGEPFRIRVGMHLGMITEMNDRVGGDPRLVGMVLNLAARVMDSGDAGQILVTRAIFDDARQCVRVHPPVEEWVDVPPVVWMVHGDYGFKGSDEPLAIFEVGAEGIAALTAPGDGAKCRKVAGTGSADVLPSLPPPPGARAAVAVGAEKEAAADELKSQREEFERAQKELQAEIERLRRSEEERERELKREAQALAMERRRLDEVAEGLAAKRREEEEAAQALLERAQRELEQAESKSAALASALGEQKEAFEKELGEKSEALERSAQQRLAELEGREREIVGREEALVGKPSPEEVRELEQARGALEAERRDLLEDSAALRAGMEEERRAFLQSQEAERRAQEEALMEAAQRADEERDRREAEHSAALDAMRSTLAEQEAELERQREELAANEERIEAMRSVGASPERPGESRVEQLNVEAQQFAEKIDELNVVLEEVKRQQKQRLVAIGVGSVVLALLVGIFSAKLIWGFYPWKLLTAAPEVQGNLVLEGLKRLEESGDWRGLLGATLSGEDQVGDDPGDREEVQAYARLAVQKLAAPPWEEWGEGGEALLETLRQAGEKGWRLPPEHGFLTASLEISRARISGLSAGVPRAIRAYLVYRDHTVGEEHTRELDRQFDTLLGELSEVIDRDVALADEDAIQEAFEEFPEEELGGTGGVALVERKMKVRDQLRVRPQNLAGALAVLQECAEKSVEWRIPLAGLFGEVLDGIGVEEGDLPNPEALLDLGTRWDDPRPMVIALNRLPVGPVRNGALLDLFELYKRDQVGGRAEGAVAFSDDAKAWVGYACVKGIEDYGVDPFFGTVEERRVKGAEILEEVSGKGHAKAKYFLVQTYELELKTILGGTQEPSADDLDSWQKLAEEAIEGGEPDALFTLGLIHHASSLLVGNADDESAAKAYGLIRLARKCYADAEMECREKQARDQATIFHAATWRILPPSVGEIEACAGSLFRVGCVYWSNGQQAQAEVNWEDAWKIDPSGTKLSAEARMREERARGGLALAEELEAWLRKKR